MKSAIKSTCPRSSNEEPKLFVSSFRGVGRLSLPYVCRSDVPLRAGGVLDDDVCHIRTASRLGLGRVPDYSGFIYMSELT